MKKIFLVISACFALTQIACVSKKNLTEPEMMTAEERNPYDAKTLIAKDTAYNWQTANRDEIAKATTREMLSQFLVDAKAPMKLLSKVGSAYESDAIALTQIATISQEVVNKKSSLATSRRIWVSALFNAFRNAKDEYRQLFYLDQLRWCADKSDVKSLRLYQQELLGCKEKKAVYDFLGQVIRELE